ncbi:MAG: response regulator [Nannocystaceae bacterium]
MRFDPDQRFSGSTLNIAQGSGEYLSMAKILVVDDAPTVRTMVGKALREDGHDITEAANGVEGLQHAEKYEFDLVVTDVNMPEMNGIELCRALRKRFTYQKVPILMLTTEGRSRLIAEGKEAGASGWIVKPFEPRKLCMAVEMLIKKSRGREAMIRRA